MIHIRKLMALEDRLDHIDMEHININVSNNPEMLEKIFSVVNRPGLLDTLTNS